MKVSKSQSRTNNNSLMKQFQSVHIQSSHNLILNMKQKQSPEPKNTHYSKEFVQDLVRKVTALEDKQKFIEEKFLFYAQKLQSEINLKQQVNQSLRSEICSLKNTLKKIQTNLQGFVKTNQIQAIKHSLKVKSPSKLCSSFLHKQNMNPYSIKRSQLNNSKNLNLQNLSPKIQISMTQRKNPNELSQYQLQQKMLQSRFRENKNDDYEFTKILTQTQNQDFDQIEVQKTKRRSKQKSSKSKLIGGLMKSRLFVK